MDNAYFWNKYPIETTTKFSHWTVPKSIPKKLWEYVNLEYLSLSQASFSRLAKEVLNLSKLKQLHLTSGQLKSLPKGMPQLPLEDIDFSHNQILNLPSDFGKLASLKKLNLNRNPLSAKSLNYLTQLSNLQELRLEKCGLEFLPDDFNKLIQLETLCVSGNQFGEMPLAITQLPKLRKLYIDKVSIPETGLGVLDKLEILSICLDTEDPNFPLWVTQLPSLQKLYIYGGGFKELPEEICTMPSLTDLRFFGCAALEKLPENIGNLKDLDFVALSKTGISELPASVGKWAKLYRFHSEGSPLKALPEEVADWEAISFLSIKNSQITSLPPSIASWKNLITLLLDKNSLLKTLPEELGELSAVQKISLEGSPIENFPENVRHLKNLKELKFDCKTLPAFPLWFMAMDLFEYQEEYKAKFKTKAFHTGKDIKKLTAIVHKAAKANINDYESRKALYYLYFGNKEAIEKLNAKQLFDTLRIKDEKVNDRSLERLFETAILIKDKPLQKGSVITVLGKLKFYKQETFAKELAKKGLIYEQSLSPKTTHLLVLPEIKAEHQAYKNKELCLISEQQLKDYIEQGDEDLYLVQKTEDNAENTQRICDLLLSKDKRSQKLAMQIIKTGGFPLGALNAMFIRYQLLDSYREKAKRKEIEKLISVHLSAQGLKALKYTCLEQDESVDKKQRDKIKKYLTNSKEFDAEYIAWYYYHNFQQCYTYLLNDAKPETRLAFLQQHYERGIMDLSGLGSLKKLPEEILQFSDMTELHLCSCDFNSFPSILYKGDFPKLKVIDFRDAPKRVKNHSYGNSVIVPKKAIQTFPNCQIFTGK